VLKASRRIGSSPKLVCQRPGRWRGRASNRPSFDLKSGRWTQWTCTPEATNFRVSRKSWSELSRRKHSS